MPVRVTFDQNRVAHVDGRPFFLIGARHMPDGGTPDILRDTGFNAFRQVVFGSESATGEAIPSDLEGIHFWAYVFDRADFTKSPDYERQLREKITELREHPALLCYENYNEPTMLYKGNRFKTEPENLARGTAVLRELDPNHPIWLCHTCFNTVETIRRYNPCLDIVGCNPYPVYVPGMRQHVGMRADGKIVDCIDQSIHSVGKYTDKMMVVAQGRPVWMLIQALANENWFNLIHTPELAGQAIEEAKIVYPTYTQMRFMAYDAIVSGATGVALSMHKTPVGSSIWDDIKHLVTELRSLHDTLCAPPLPGVIDVNYTDLGFTIWDGVRVLARRLGDEVYVFAVNTAFDPAETAILLPVDLGSAAEVLGEDREIAVAGNAIRDRFEPYAVHVYKIRAKDGS
jgi:hypothetical protein